MKRPVKALVQKTRQKREANRRTLAAERARIRLPYKPEHVTEEQIREAVASLRS